MHATFCPTCGETRWQLTALPVARTSACSVCGGTVRPERRLPGRKVTGPPPGERRIGVRLPGESPAAPPPTSFG